MRETRLSGSEGGATFTQSSLPLSIVQSLRDANFSATRSACAAIVSAGLQAADEGKNELSTT